MAPTTLSTGLAPHPRWRTRHTPPSFPGEAAALPAGPGSLPAAPGSLPAMAPSVAERLLERLDQAGGSGGLCSVEAAAELGVDHQTLVGAVKSLQALGEVIEAEARTATRWELSPEGQEVLRDGSPEVRLFRSLPEEGLPQGEAMKLPGGSLGFSKAMANKWVRLDKGAAGGPRVLRAVPSVQDTVQEHLGQVRAGRAQALPERDRAELKRRKLLLEVVLKSFWIRKGSAFSTAVARPETELTPEMIATGSWRRLPFKPYNFSSLGLPPACGHLHPLLKVRSELRQIFLEMGFTEMRTDNFVESSFWNFDALFQPQQHPARDQHDTFFLLGGSEEFWGGVSRCFLPSPRQEKFTPVKYFSIDRVFRNESLDATHLAEFHQVEGVVADRGLTLGHLMGILRQFFTKLGISQLRFKPAYNPYTEPSMEVFSYHEGLKKWVEVGNSGVFRPELLLPMGLPENISVIAWGLSLERPTMIKYGINNIRELMGHRVNLQMVYDSPMCRLDV
ncbi:phenylalanine--tRNA ligase alpha subunit [Parus major]|nr:phenylalanine--tRNA ligase alpha subunit [Parus major]